MTRFLLKRLVAITLLGLSATAWGECVKKPHLVSSCVVKPPDPSPRLMIDRFGGVRIGMTVAQARKAAPGHFWPANDYAGGSCDYATMSKPTPKPSKVIDDATFMVEDGRVTRIDVSKPGIKTQSGIGVGDTEAAVKARYANIVVQPHKYEPKGHYLIYKPKDKALARYRLVFETDGKRVTRFRSGIEPSVEYVEGCS